MSSSPAPESCQVSLLVPHPDRIAVLVTDVEAGHAEAEQPSAPTLPTLRMDTAWPSLSEILATVDVVDGEATAVLRMVVASTAEDASEGEAALLVEFDAGPAEAPSGWSWLDLDAQAIGRLAPVTCQAAVRSWVRERAEGWSPLRPQWSAPGWFARASTWMADELAAYGRPIVGVPKQHQLWDLSVVLRAATSDGDVFFKCSIEAFRHEGRAARALAERTPELVPEVIAVDEARGWMVMRDMGAAELGDQDQSLWTEGVVAHAAIQRAWAGRTDELEALGLPVRSLTSLASYVESTTTDTELLGRMAADLRERWSASVPALVESCRRLHEIGPAPTLVHGDLHPWNVAFGPATTRVFDWTDAAVSHPFVDLATYVYRSQDKAVRRRLVDAYLAAWSAAGSAEQLREAATLALVVGSLYQVQTYRALLPQLMRDGADAGLADADVSWLELTLSRHAHGLDSPK